MAPAIFFWPTGAFGPCPPPLLNTSRGRWPLPPLLKPQGAFAPALPSLCSFFLAGPIGPAIPLFGRGLWPLPFLSSQQEPSALASLFGNPAGADGPCPSLSCLAGADGPCPSLNIRQGPMAPAPVSFAGMGHWTLPCSVSDRQEPLIPALFCREAETPVLYCRFPYSFKCMLITYLAAYATGSVRAPWPDPRIILSCRRTQLHDIPR